MVLPTCVGEERGDDQCNPARQCCRRYPEGTVVEDHEDDAGDVDSVNVIG